MTTNPLELPGTALLREGAKVPAKAHAKDAGYDLVAPVACRFLPWQRLRLDLGITVTVPPGCVGLVKDRSGWALKGLHGLGGVIDEGYEGELSVILQNLNASPLEVAAGERIAQLVILPVYAAPSAGPTQEVEQPVAQPAARGKKGLGSTGR